MCLDPHSAGPSQAAKEYQRLYYPEDYLLYYWEAGDQFPDLHLRVLEPMIHRVDRHDLTQAFKQKWS